MIEHRELALGILIGVTGLLALKYVVIGLEAWDACLHPGRVEPASLRAFMKPFLSNLPNCHKCAAFWGVQSNG